MTTNFFSPLSFVAVFGSGIRDPGSGMGKNQDPGSATLPASVVKLALGMHNLMHNGHASLVSSLLPCLQAQFRNFSSFIGAPIQTGHHIHCPLPSAAFSPGTIFLLLSKMTMRGVENSLFWLLITRFRG